MRLQTLVSARCGVSVTVQDGYRQPPSATSPARDLNFEGRSLDITFTTTPTSGCSKPTPPPVGAWPRECACMP